MDILNVTKDYADCRSGGAVTEPDGGTWVSAIALYLGATEPVNGSWIQALCAAEGVTAPVNDSWVQALAESYGLTEPVNGTWWFAIADHWCNGGPTPPPSFIWNLNTRLWNTEPRVWAAAPVLDPDAQAFITAAGITDSTQESAINQLVLDLKSASIWSKMQIIYPIVGGTATTHKYNLKDPRDLDAAYRLSFNGTFVHNANGAAATSGAPTPYADTHWIPNNQTFTNGVHWSANIYSEGSLSQYNMGIAQSGDWAIINDYGPGSNLDYWQAGTGGYLTTSTATGIGYTLGTSNGTNFRGLYVDGSLGASNTTGSISSSQSIPAYLWAVNNNNSAIGPSDDFANFYTIGEYLNSTEVAALNTAKNTFNTTLGR